jgi:hypothetical protein
MRKNSVGKEVRMQRLAKKISLSGLISRGVMSGLVLMASAYQLLGQTNQPTSQVERNREKAYLRQQFARHFRSVQVLSQDLLKAHEEGNLTARGLGKEAREINKSARSLRQLIALGALAEERELKTSLTTPADFDEAIRLLAQMIRRFARNPSHQNSRILNTDQATEAQTDLLAIIRLSKTLADQARGYQTLRQ